MKGLILKDLYVLKSLGKQFGLAFCFLFLWSIMMKSFSFLIIYCVIMCGSIVMSTMSYDESVSFNRFVLTAPVNIKMLVWAKYVLILLLLLATLVVGALLNIFHLFGAEQAFEWGGITVAAAIFMVTNAISLPFMFKFGVEKARYVYILCMLLVGGIMVGTEYLAQKSGISFLQLEERLSEGGINIIFIVIVAASMVISYFASVKVASKKEW